MSEREPSHREAIAPDRMINLEPSHRETLGANSMSENGPTRSELRQIQDVRSRQSSQAVLTTQAHPDQAYSADATSQAQTRIHTSTDASSGAMLSDSSSPTPSTRTDTLPTSAILTNTHSADHPQNASKAAESPQLRNQDNTIARALGDTASSSTVRAQDIAQSPPPVSHPTSTGDSLSKFLGADTGKRSGNMPLYTYEASLEPFTKELKDEVKKSCSVRRMKEGYRSVGFYLTRIKRRVKPLLLLQCYEDVKSECENAVRNIQVGDIARKYAILQGWRARWEPTRWDNPINMKSKKNAIKIIIEHVEPLSLSAFGMPFDDPSTKATITGIINLDGSFFLTTEHQQRQRQDLSEEEPIDPGNCDDTPEKDSHCEDSSDDSGEESSDSDSCDDPSEEDLHSEDSRDNSDVWRAARYSEGHDVPSVGSSETLLPKVMYDPRVAEPYVIPTMTGSVRSSTCSTNESNITANADQGPSVSSASTPAEEHSDSYCECYVAPSLQPGWTDFSRDSLSKLSNTRILAPYKENFVNTEIRQMRPAGVQTLPAESLDLLKDRRPSRDAGSHGSPLTTPSDASNNIYTHDREAPCSVLFTTDVIDNESPKDFIMQSQHGCVLPACSNFSPSAEKHSLTPVPNPESQLNMNSVLPPHTRFLRPDNSQGSSKFQLESAGTHCPETCSTSSECSHHDSARREDNYGRNLLPSSENPFADVVDQSSEHTASQMGIHIKRAPRWQNKEIDWAAYQQGNAHDTPVAQNHPGTTRQSFVNRVLLRCTETICHQVFITDIATRPGDCGDGSAKDPNEGRQFWVKTRAGLLPAHGLSNQWVNSKWRIQLQDGKFQKGDSGSPVFDVRTGLLYGMLTEAVVADGIGFIVPAPEIEEDARKTCKLAYDENSFQGSFEHADPSSSDLPSKSATVDMLPSNHRILPQRIDVLALFVRDGYFQIFRQLFDIMCKEKTHSGDTIEWPNMLHQLLREALQFDQQIVVSYILEKAKPDVNALDAFKQAPLHYAAGLGRLDICKLLISYGARVNVQNAGDSTPLLIAIKNLHPEVAEYLISKDQDGSTRTRADGKGMTPLGMASFHNLDSVMKYLLQDGTARLDSQQYQHALHNIIVGDGNRGQSQLNDTVEDPSHSSMNGYGKDAVSDSSSIDESAHDSEKKIICLRTLWSSPQVQDLSKSEELYDAMQEATKAGEQECFHAILEKVGKQECRSYQQAINNCLVYGCISRSLRIVESLLDYEIDPLHEIEGTSALQAAVESGVCSLIRLLLDKVQKTNRNIDRQTAINWAAKKGHAEAITLLAQDGTCINHPGIVYRESPLHSAATNGHVDALRELIKVPDRWTIDCKDYLGRTPMMLAARKGHIQVMLLLHHIDENHSHTDGVGSTAVELAAMRGQAAAVDWILENCSVEVNDRALCAAAGSRDCTPDSMEALLLHGGPENSLAVLRNSLLGHPDMPDFLLGQESIHFLELPPAIAERAMQKLGYKAFVRLHEQCGTSLNDKTSFLAAMKNTQDASNIVQWLLSHHENATWDDDSLICAASANDVFGFDLVDFILKNFPKTEITVKALENAAGNARWSCDIFQALFSHHSFGPISVTNRLLKELEGNCIQSSDASKLLITAPQVKFGLPEVLEAVRTFDLDIIKLLLNRRLDDSRVTLFSEMFVDHPARLEALFEAAIHNKLNGREPESDGEISSSLVEFLLEVTSEKGVVLECDARMVVTLAKKASDEWNYSSRIMKQLLTAECVVYPATEKSLQAAFVEIVGAFDPEVLRLAIQKFGCRPRLSAFLLAAAASNAKSAKVLVADLLEAPRSGLANNSISMTHVTEAVILSAARNEDSGALISQLAPYFSRDILTPSFWRAVCSNTTQAVRIAELLLDLHGVESGVVYMVQNFWDIGEELLKTLPKHQREPMISKKLALIAASHMHVSALTDILDHAPHIAPIDELLKAACKNCKDGHHVATLLLERWPTDLTGQHVPKTVMLATVENWMSADRILEAFKSHKMRFTVTEKVLVAAVQNPISSVEVVQLLLHEVDKSTLITPQILTQAAANIARPLKLLKILLPEACDHLLTESVLEAAAGNGAASRELLMFLRTRIDPQAITSKVILAAAKNSQTGRMGLVMPMHTVSCNHTAKASWMLKNRNRLLPSSWHRDSDCSFYFTPGSAYNVKSPANFGLLWGNARSVYKLYSMKVRLQREWAWREGFSFLEYLLVQAPNVDVGSILEEAAEFTTPAMMRLLLNHTKNVTAQTLRRAVGNELHGAEVTDMLLLQHPHLKISIDTWAAALDNNEQGSGILDILCSYSETPPVESIFLEHTAETLYIDERRLERIAGRSDVVSQKVLKCSALNEQNGYNLVRGLMKNPSDIGDDFVANAMKNTVFAPRLLEFILCCGKYTEVSPTVLTAAAANQTSAPQLLARLLQFWREDLRTSIPDILASAAGNEGTGPEALAYLLNFLGEDCRVYINISVLRAAVMNRMHGSHITGTFFAIQTEIGQSNEHFSNSISAAVRNESQGDTIMKMLFQNVTCDNGAHCDEAVFTAAARNIGCGSSLMALLIDHFKPTTLPLSTWMAACKNEFDGPGLVAVMLQKTADRCFIGKELFLAAATNKSGGTEILSSLLSNSSTLLFTEFLADINQFTAGSSITDDIIAMVSQIDGDIPFIHLNISTLAQLEVDTVQRLSQKAKAFMVSDARFQKLSFFDHGLDKNSVGIPVQKAILADKRIRLTRPVVERFARSCDGEVFDILAERYDKFELFPAVSQNKVHGAQIFKSCIESKVLLDDPSPLSFAIRHKNLTLLKTLLSEASQPTIRGVIVNAATDVEVLQLLLEKVVDLEVTEELLIAACPNVACLRLLLEHNRDIKPEITENIMLAAVKVARTPNSILLLMDNLRETPITEDLLVAAIEKVEAIGLEALARIIESMTPLHLSSTIVVKAVSKGEILKLLIKKFEKIPLSQQVLETAVLHPEHLELLLDHKQETLEFSIILSTGVAHKDSWDHVEKLMAANGKSPVEITEGMLKSSMKCPEQLRNLLKRYKPRVCSQSLLAMAARNGASTLDAIQQHFVGSKFSQHTIELVKEKVTPSTFLKLLGESPPSSLVYALLGLQDWLPLRDDDKKVAFLVSRVKSILPTQILPSTLFYSPAFFEDIVGANEAKFVTQVLLRGLERLSGTQSNLEVALFNHFSPLNTGRFSQNLISLIERHKHLATEELLIHSLLCEVTPFEIIHTILQILRPSLEQLQFVAEVAGQAGNNGRATLRLLLGMLDTMSVEQITAPTKQMIERMLIGDRDLAFSQPQKLYAKTSNVAGDVETKSTGSRVSRGEKGDDDLVPSDDETDDEDQAYNSRKSMKEPSKSDSVGKKSFWSSSSSL